MLISDALNLINQGLVYKPGWSFLATDHTNRFEGTVMVRIDYVAQNSNRDQACLGYPETISTYATFPLVVADCTQDAVLRKIILAIVEIETHEAREFLRLRETWDAPFHPHRIAGMKGWHGRNMMPDLQFGIA